MKKNETVKNNIVDEEIINNQKELKLKQKIFDEPKNTTGEKATDFKPSRATANIEKQLNSTNYWDFLGIEENALNISDEQQISHNMHKIAEKAETQKTKNQNHTENEKTIKTEKSVETEKEIKNQPKNKKASKTFGDKVKEKTKALFGKNEQALSSKKKAGQNFNIKTSSKNVLNNNVSQNKINSENLTTDDFETENFEKVDNINKEQNNTILKNLSENKTADDKNKSKNEAVCFKQTVQEVHYGIPPEKEPDHSEFMHTSSISLQQNAAIEKTRLVPPPPPRPRLAENTQSGSNQAFVQKNFKKISQSEPNTLQTGGWHNALKLNEINQTTQNGEVIMNNSSKHIPDNINNLENNKRSPFKKFKAMNRSDKIIGVLSAICIFLFILSSCLLLSLSNKNVFIIEETANGRSLVGITQEGSELTNLTIPDGVEYIGSNAFLPSMLALVNINIPASVVKIDKNAFAGCLNLQNVIFTGKSNLKYLEDNAFMSCLNLRNVTINQANEINFERTPFYGCANLVLTFKNNIVPNVPSGLKDPEPKAVFVPSGAVEDFKTQLKTQNVYAANSILQNKFVVSEKTIVKYVGTEASVVVPQGIEKIGVGAFKNNALLEEINLTNVKVISENAFLNCTNLKKVTHAGLLRIIGDNAFVDCKKIPEFDFRNVGTIGQNAFSQTGLKSIDLKVMSMATLGNYAFSSCSNLQSATLPSSLGKTPEGLFSQCGALATVNLNNVAEIGNQTFNYASSLKSIDLSKISQIGDYAFRGSGLEHVDFSQNLISLGISSFASTKIDSVVLKKRIKEIGGSAFKDCENLTTVNLQAGVETINERAFFGCTITTLTLPSTGDLFIKDFAFAENNISSLYLGSNIKQLAYRCFSDADFNRVEVAADVNWSELNINYAFYSSSITTFKISEGLTHLNLPENLLDGISSIQHFMLPLSLTSIYKEGSYERFSSRIKNIFIYENVSSIYYNSFQYLTAESTVHFVNRTEEQVIAGITGGWKTYGSPKYCYSCTHLPQ